MKSLITGRITAVNSKTWNDGDRKVRPFKVDADTPWITIVDEAIERTFPEGEWEQHEEFLNEEEAA